MLGTTLCRQDVDVDNDDESSHTTALSKYEKWIFAVAILDVVVIVVVIIIGVVTVYAAAARFR